MRKLLFFIVILFSLFLVIAQNETATQPAIPTEATTETTTPSASEKKPELKTEAGITPDSLLYIVDDLAERVMIGDNPERALSYREEKIAEAKEMIEKGKPKEAEEVLDKAMKYGDVLEKEVSPEMRERVKDSREAVEHVLDEMKEKTEGEEWKNVKENFEEVEKKEEKITTAAELVSKINELCETLAKLDPLQYADNCRPKDSSPRWMREKDRELTKEQEEQAKIFFEKLSGCFENPKECDCKGMGIQSFEDMCLEKSQLAVKCFEGDKEACKEMDTGNPADLLPDYLADVFRKVENKYSKSQFDNFAPSECVEANAKTPKECNKIMFKLNAPQECIEAGLTGESREDEMKCKNLMFETNAPEECLKAGITADDKDAPRKCAKIMFQEHAPEECIQAGLTGEKREDDKKCRELMEKRGKGQREMRKGPSFNKDCKAIQDTAEKVKCYEEFYNNAQFQVKDDFREREFRQPGEESRECQTLEQIEKLKQDCESHGEWGRVEDRGGCPWVICEGRQEGEKQEFKQKCPDNVCDDYERMNPWACPEDCGGAREQPKYPQPPEQQQYQQPPQMQQPPIEQQYMQPPLEQQPQMPPTTQPPTEIPTTAPTTTQPATTTPTTQPSPETTQTQPATTTPTTQPLTGSVIFWRYWFKER